MITKKDLEPIVLKAAQETGLSTDLIEAVIQQESNWNPRAVSGAGAKGLMQLMPDTAKELSVMDPFDPEQSIMGGSRYLKKMLDRFGSTELALAAYNAGAGNVIKHAGIPPFRETQEYVQKIMSRLPREDTSLDLQPIKHRIDVGKYLGGGRFSRDVGAPAEREETPKDDTSLEAAALGAARGVSLGLSDAALTAMNFYKPKELASIKEENSGASTVGEVGSLLIPGGGAVGLIGRGVRGALGLGRAARVAAGVAEGASMGLGHAISEDALGTPGMNAERYIAHMGMGALFGGAATGLGLAAEAGIDRAVRYVGKRSIGKMAQVIPERFEQEIGDATIEAQTLSAPMARAERDAVADLTVASPELNIGAERMSLEPFGPKQSAVIQRGVVQKRPELDDTFIPDTLVRKQGPVVATPEMYPGPEGYGMRTLLRRVMDLHGKSFGPEIKAEDLLSDTASGRLASMERPAAIKAEDLLSDTATGRISLGEELPRIAEGDATRVVASPRTEALKQLGSKRMKQRISEILVGGAKLGAVAGAGAAAAGSLGLAGAQGAAAAVAMRYMARKSTKNLLDSTIISDELTKWANRAIDKSVVVAPRAAKTLSLSTLALITPPKKDEDEQDALQRLRSDLDDISASPGVLENGIRRTFLDIASDAPATAVALQHRVFNNLMWLQGQIPRPTAGALPFSKQRPVVSRSDLAAFRAKAIAVMDPMSAISGIIGGAIDEGTIRALDATSPELMQQLRGAMTKFLVEHKGDIPFDTRKRIQSIMGIQLTPPVDDNMMKILQAPSLENEEKNNDSVKIKLGGSASRAQELEGLRD